jgi:hypothetical protein
VAFSLPSDFCAFADDWRAGAKRLEEIFSLGIERDRSSLRLKKISPAAEELLAELLRLPGRESSDEQM